MTSLSHDFFSEVDDPKHILRTILTPQIMHSFEKTGAPPYRLDLKVNDVCIVLRNLTEIGLANNSRVRILDFIGSDFNTQPKAIRVQTIEDTPRICFIPKIRFKIQAGKASYQITRTQFPLRLAYAMTYNKSQSQTLHKVIVDVIDAPFAHGHLYVAFSRIRDANNIRILTKPDTIYESIDNAECKGVCVTNVIMPTVIDQIP
jgi:hypothetical protein